MPDKGTVVEGAWLWTDKLLWTIVGLFVFGSMARSLVSDEPFDVRKLIGELIFSGIAAIIMYSMGLMQGMNEYQIVCFGALGSLGGVRSVEWALKAMNQFKSAGSER